MRDEDLGKHGKMPPFGPATVSDIAKAHPDIVAELRMLDPISSAATFGGLLAMPDLQANCYRIEALVHLAVEYCAGRTAPTNEFMRRSFEHLGDGYCGRMEDPAEDVFATLVNTPRGNFRIFEGIREGTGFHLQRILNVVESMSEHPPYNRIRSSAECMLKLSDAVAARAGVRENSLGREMPLDTLPSGLANQPSSARGFIRFSDDDLARLDVSKALLDDFAFRPNERTELGARPIGHTHLERRPVVFDGHSAHLVLPTAVASAITRFVVESVLSLGWTETFERALADEFAKLLNETPIVGGRSGAPIRFQRMSGGRIGAVMTEVDPGRFLHLIFFVDGLDGFLQDGLGRRNADPNALSSAVAEHLKHARAQAEQATSFRDGLSLLVGCGFVRALCCAIDGALPERWRLELIAAHDLVTLSWVSGFDRLSLWRLLDAKQAIERQGAALLNLNGILNLVAWSRQLEGHLVPHGQLPDAVAAPGTATWIMVSQNAVRELRHSVITEWDPRRVPDSDARWVMVRRLGNSLFEEDNAAPLFASEEDLPKGRLRAVYLATKRPWWIEIVAPECARRGPVFEHWRMLCTWLRRAAPVLDKAYSGLPSSPISFVVSFAQIVGATRGTVRPKNAHDLAALIQVSPDAGHQQVRILIAEGFDDALTQPENVAERAVVEALVGGAAAIGGELADLEKRARLADEICPNSQAKCIHRLEARSYRDYVAPDVAGAPLLIDPLDAAASRIGLGWRVRSRCSAPEISGKRECTSFLNDLVRAVLDDLCGTLNSLDRRSFVSAALHNHEVAARDRDVWNHTAQANLAMHDNKDAALRVIVDHLTLLNACFMSSRILLEAAICECPLEGGETPGRLDLSRAMTQVMLAYHLGGWSDAIHWGAMEPSLRITPLGDVHMNHSFMDAVYDPFGRLWEGDRVGRAIDSYAELYLPVKNPPSVADLVEPEFLHAWQAEFGLSLEGVRAFVDGLEGFGLGLQPPRAVLRLPRSALRVMLAEAAGVSSEDASVALDMVTSVPRAAWRVVSGEFKDSDWYPWRFRRRLSIVRRPLVQIDSGDDPIVVFAPGLVREALYMIVSWHHSGEIRESEARSAAMRSWTGHANHVQRLKFNSTVADRMRELGWQVEQEVRLTKILGRSLASGVTSKPAIRGHFKTGHRKPTQNTCFIPRQRRFPQALFLRTSARGGSGLY